MAGGGFVFSAVHNIQADVPPENVVAMWQAIHELGLCGKDDDRDGQR
jgi:uroporphyrinogen decarboxylase